MKIPRKISPDNLKDTIVEFRFSSAIPLDLIPGKASIEFFELGYEYIPLNKPNISFNQGNDENAITLGINSDRSGFFVKDNVRIQFVNDSIVFNCLQDKYVGWEKYFRVIQEITRLLVKKQLVKEFKKVAVRYISVFENIDIFQNIKVGIRVADIGFGLDDSVLRLSREEENIKIFLTLTNRAKRPNHNKKAGTQTSLVDIHAYHEFHSTESYDNVVSVLDKIHKLEKETFFRLLTEDFLMSLNPEY